jgi:plastocyanin
MIAVIVVLFAAGGAGGGDEGIGAATPTPTTPVASTPAIGEIPIPPETIVTRAESVSTVLKYGVEAPVSTATPSDPTPTAPPTVSPTPVDEPTSVPVATIVIRALENPYRFEPDTIDLEVGKTYALELVGSEKDDEMHSFVVWRPNPKEGEGPVINEIVPPHKNVAVSFAPDQTGEYLFVCEYHRMVIKEGIMKGKFIVTK